MIRHLSMRVSRPVMKGETSDFESKTTRVPTHGVSALLFAMMSLVALPAAAQRTDDNAVIDAQYPLVKDVLGAAVSIAHWNDFDYNYARTSGNLGFSLLLRIRPDERSEILPFVGYIHNGERQVLPTVFANGLNPLPMFNEQQLPAQDWTSWGWNQLTAGIVAKSVLGSSWRLAAGVFRSLSQYSQNFN